MFRCRKHNFFPSLIHLSSFNEPHASQYICTDSKIICIDVSSLDTKYVGRVVRAGAGMAQECIPINTITFVQSAGD